MKKIIYLCLVFSTLVLTGCVDENKDAKINSPAQTAFDMSFYASSDRVFYNDFKELFDEQRDDDFIRNRYELVKQIQGDSGGATSTLALIEYQNNETVLVQLRYDTDTGKYMIYNVIEVPEEIATFLKNELH